MSKKLNYFKERAKSGGIFRQVVILCVCLFGFPAFFADISAQADGKLPQGMWGVVEVTVDKKTEVAVEQKTDGTVARNTNGTTVAGNVFNTAIKSERNVYKAADKVQSYFLSPKSWEVIDSETIVLRYQNGREETAKYTLEGNQLKIETPVAVQSYQCSMEGETMIISCTHNYSNNLPGRIAENIEEKWTVTFIIIKK